MVNLLFIIIIVDQFVVSRYTFYVIKKNWKSCSENIFKTLTGLEAKKLTRVEAKNISRIII